jgi:asparagine synthase (glutamine-hydrolysing)
MTGSGTGPSEEATVFSRDESWFAVFPDHPAVRGQADALLPAASHVLRHPSGRPWFVGSLPAGDLVAATAGPVRLALVGGIPAGLDDQLAELAGRIADLAGVDRVAAAVPGCYHLVAAVGGQLRVQAGLAEIRRTYHAAVAGVTVAADRADLLAALSGAALDQRRFAAHLLAPLPRAVAGLPLWHGIAAVPGDHALQVSVDGRGRMVRRWTPPAAEQPAAAGIARLRSALDGAVAIRVRAAGDLVSADLSGGLDSTSLCFLAHRAGARLLAVTAPSRDPGNDDTRWADLAAAALPGADRLVTGDDEVGMEFGGAAHAGAGMDAPLPELTAYGQLDRLAGLLAARGSRLHLTGLGADELFQSRPAYLHQLIRTRPLVALDQVRAYRALRHWPLRGIVRGLADRRDYPTWLAGQAARLAAATPPDRYPGDWGHPPALPPWVTGDGRREVSRVLAEAAGTAAPHGPDRAVHATLESIRSSGAVVRQLAGVMARHGVLMEAPYLDDAVVEATLAVRLADRTSPWVYKPLLVAAMRGTVPDRVLARTTKGDTSADVYAGLRRHRPELLDLCEGSRLAAAGLVDAERLRDALLAPASLDDLTAICSTLACEVWLRAHADTPVTTKG